MKKLKHDIEELAKTQQEIKTQDIVSLFGVSRQYAHKAVSILCHEKKLIKIGSTRSSFYCLPEHSKKLKKVTQKIQNLQQHEHEVLENLEKKAFFLKEINENLYSIFYYAFSEMLNNAIEHSKSSNIQISVSLEDKNLEFHIDDFGIGVFRNVMKKKKLKSELEAIQDILKGKTTTAPQAHSGEGIFFTSKTADIYELESYGYRLTVNNLIRDTFIEEVPSNKKGTKVTFKIACDTQKHMSDIFHKYQTNPTEHAFDKTEIQVKLYTLGTIHISRSQARRILSNLDKFKSIILDFDKVPTVGQAFADEIFRIFHSKHPEIQITPINMTKTVEFMVKRVGV